MHPSDPHKSLSADDDREESSENDDVIPSDSDPEPDVPPGSFWLSKDAEYDWFDRNAFLDRKDSTKGGPISTCSSNSQRFSVSLKSRASIIGLPRTQKDTFADSKRRTCNRPASVRLFPNRSDSIGKSSALVVEPGSPKVSCIGRVRSKRCRRRSNSSKRKDKQQIEKSSTAGGGGGGGGGGEKQKAGFYSKVISMFRRKKGHRKPLRSASRKVVVEEEQLVVEVRRRSVSVKVREIPAAEEPAGLGEMKRFASGRRQGSWTADDFNLAAGSGIGGLIEARGYQPVA